MLFRSITPKSIVKEVRDVISLGAESDEYTKGSKKYDKDPESMTRKELEKEIQKLTKNMNKAAAELNFELAASLRDDIKELKIILRDYDS